MSSRLPPLNALRAFDAAARHLSFTRAAEELHVTQAAVSHQIRALEEHLDVALFTRKTRALELTSDGERYHPGVRAAFERLVRATEELRHTDSRGRLAVSVMPSFAARWLVPRMGRFQAAHPEIDLFIAPSREIVDFDREPVDVAIRYTNRAFPTLSTERLMSDEMYPVCAPSLVDAQGGELKPDDLRTMTLLHDEGSIDWETWLREQRISGIDASRGPVFIDSSMLIQAAIDGLGVALARRVLVADEINAGRLVRPFLAGLPNHQKFAYYFVCPERTADMPKIEAFRSWLLTECANELGENPDEQGKP